MGIGAIVFLALVIAAVVFVVGIYNKLVTYRNRYKNGFAQIEVQLKRRYDLIPNLVETAKAYMAHEQETLTAVIAARNQAAKRLETAAASPGSGLVMEKLMGAEEALAGALGKLHFVMEAYPDLKASQNMLQLSEELASTENRVSFARQAYNDQVMVYNTFRQSFPPVFFASLFGHAEDATALEFADSKQIQDAPKVRF
ncbi:MAG: LemA family protein [Desulfopila sp.]